MLMDRRCVGRSIGDPRGSNPGILKGEVIVSLATGYGSVYGRVPVTRVHTVPVQKGVSRSHFAFAN